MTQKSFQPPHIFAIADAAYQAMLGIGAGTNPKSQCCVIRYEDFDSSSYLLVTVGSGGGVCWLWLWLILVLVAFNPVLSKGDC